MVLLSVGWSTEVCGCLAAPGSNIFFDACSVCLCVAGMSLCRKILQLFFGPLLVQAMCGAQSLTTSLDHENSYGLLASSSSCFLEGQCCNLLVLWKGISGCRMRKSFSWKAAISLAIWETSVFVAKAKGLYKINSAELNSWRYRNCCVKASGGH